MQKSELFSSFFVTFADFTLDIQDNPRIIEETTKGLLQLGVVSISFLNYFVKTSMK